MNTSVAAVLRAFDDGRARAEFYRSWRSGHAAGLPHPTILEMAVARGTLTAALRDHLLDGTRRGRDLAALLRQRPELTEPFEASLLTMGEESGQLERVFGELSDFFHRQHRLITKVKSWLTYPMFVSLVAVVLLPLPLVFQGHVTEYWVAAGGGLLLWFFAGGVVLARLAQRYQRRPAFVRARFARTLALCLGAGLALDRSLLLAAQASGSPELEAHLRRQGPRRLGDQSLRQSLAGAPTLTPDFHGALEVAERTGDFATTLGRLADLYEDGFR